MFFFFLEVLQKVDLHPKTNNTDHHTVEVSEEQLILRRGQAFILTLHLTQPVNIQHLLPLKFTALTGWCLVQLCGRQSFSSILSPSAYAVNLNLNNEDVPLASLVLLFNPWCPDDSVFLSDEVQRQEYVMNEQGMIYVGSGNYISSVPWDYGQFEDDMVKICMKMLNVSHLHKKHPAQDVASRCDPIYISRLISAMINSEDDCGVLEGRWEGSFASGVRPTHWTGSHEILRRWFSTNCRPVKYGQCWVFASVMCSVMRLLGIPSRVVTNFNSAHDTNENLTIDVYHPMDRMMEIPSYDSIWNFHVWVESWMTRPDLAEDGKFDGWQVVDPTPQELSDGVYCCGPASVKSILNGNTDLNYDVPFVFAEVNADCVDWLVRSDGSTRKMFTDSKRVGQSVSTKSVGSKKRLDITDTYKHREGQHSKHVLREQKQGGTHLPLEHRNHSWGEIVF
uniref:Protein-glutamine gamma-glutamyltransferase 2 n=1 Tax=Sphaeramia orbicularis TaxID=375764 RepID=A0A673A9E6_9TELE